MSTRSVIARKTAEGFKGIYHHWDGYPSGLGATLFDLYNSHFGKDIEKMLQYLIDEHPAGWSTINGANFFYPPGPREDSNLEPCAKCGNPSWAHYRQYYSGNGNGHKSYWELAGKPAIPPGNETLCLGHSMEHAKEDKPHGPECFGDGDNPITQENASGCGCEFAYVFDGNGTMEIWVSYCGEGEFQGSKMIGAFGCGDPKAVWGCRAKIQLNSQVPDWKKLTDKLFN